MSSAAPLLFLSSGDLIADRRYDHAKALEARGDVAAAAELLAQAIEQAPRFISAWFTLGELRERMGDPSGAIKAYREVLIHDSEDRHGAALRLVRLGAIGENVPMPPGYVRALFDQYAPRFDHALIDGLNYCGPDVIRAAIEKTCHELGQPLHFSSMLDLGCGTGLAGAAFRRCVERMTGIDLSGGMIAAAKAKGFYQRFECAELISFMNGEAVSGVRYDLMIAADVLMYVADLMPVFSAAAKLMTMNALFGFTVETHAGSGVVLGETLRYAHSRDYVATALERTGLKPFLIDKASTRTENHRPVPGLAVVAGRS